MHIPLRRKSCNEYLELSFKITQQNQIIFYSNDNDAMVCGSGVYRLTRWTKYERAGVHQTVLYDPDVERRTTSN